MTNIKDCECVGCARAISSASMPDAGFIPLCRSCRPSRKAVAEVDGDVECSECGCRFSDEHLGRNATTICAHCFYGIDRDSILNAVQDEVASEAA